MSVSRLESPDQFSIACARRCRDLSVSRLESPDQFSIVCARRCKAGWWRSVGGGRRATERARVPTRRAQSGTIHARFHQARPVQNHPRTVPPGATSPEPFAHGSTRRDQSGTLRARASARRGQSGTVRARFRIGRWTTVVVWGFERLSAQITGSIFNSVCVEVRGGRAAFCWWWAPRGGLRKITGQAQPVRNHPRVVPPGANSPEPSARGSASRNQSGTIQSL